MLMIHWREALHEKVSSSKKKDKDYKSESSKSSPKTRHQVRFSEKPVAIDQDSNWKEEHKYIFSHTNDKGSISEFRKTEFSNSSENVLEENNSNSSHQPLDDSEFIHAINSKVSICQDTLITLKEIKHSKWLSKFDNMAEHLEWMLLDIHRLCLDQVGASNLRKYAKRTYDRPQNNTYETDLKQNWWNSNEESDTEREFYDAIDHPISSSNEEEKVVCKEQSLDNMPVWSQMVKRSSALIDGTNWCWTTQRNSLPAPKPNLSTNIFRILKDWIGKDLGHFAVPVYFNEPISMLQRVWEPMQNEFLLSEAWNQETPELRLLYFTAFCIAQYAGTHHRMTKPFNPILGETFEFVTPKWKFMSEQVSHHPPISAGHVSHKDYSLWMNTHVKSKFWGKSIEFRPLGSIKFKIHSTGEVITWTRPSTFLNGFLIGQKYLDHCGDMKITMRYA